MRRLGTQRLPLSLCVNEQVSSVPARGAWSSHSNADYFLFILSGQLLVDEAFSHRTAEPKQVLEER